MYPSKKASLKMTKIGGRNMWQPKLFITQGAAERSPLFGKLINSKPKKIRQIFFLFPESTQNAVLHQRVLDRTSLKWRPWILSVAVRDLENNFRCNDSNFPSYRLLESFQSLGTLLVSLCFEGAPEKKIAGGQMCGCEMHAVLLPATRRFL